MRLFGYYASHAFVNQVRKLLKTWVLIFMVVCGLIGGLMGFGAASLHDAAESRQEQVQETEEAADDTEKDSGPALPGFLKQYGASLSAIEWLELAAALLILVVFVYELMSADRNGSKIFLPADVALLFPSPMQPQSVLLFRLMNQLGVLLLSTIYLAFQIPNLVYNLDLSAWAAGGVLMAWGFTIIIGKLLNMLCYTISATYENTKKYLRRGVYGLLLILVAACLIYSRSTGQNYLEALFSFVHHPAMNWIPLWGWIKMFCMFTVNQNLTGALLTAALLVVSTFVLVWIVWKIKADFYEDAMAKSEQTAELMEVARAEKSTGFVHRKKDRSDKLRRDGMTHGSGANVFFFKSMYNRFRFAHFGLFTKTTETYLVAAICVYALCVYMVGREPVLPLALTLGALAFFRTLGNPLEEDTSKDFFRMIPASTWSKLFWSILAGTVNCFLDLLPAIALILIVSAGNNWLLLAWIPVILSVDFYGSNVGAFINLSVPVSAGVTLKRSIQVLFVYFGLLPDIAILAVGIVLDHVVLAAIGATLINVALGFLFLAFTPWFLDHPEKEVHPPHTWTTEETTNARRSFSLLGLSGFVLLAVSSALQLTLPSLFPQYLDAVWAKWVYTFAPLYLVGTPLAIYIIKKVPKAPAGRKVLPYAQDRLRVGQFVKAFFIMIFFMYAGNYIGRLLLLILNSMAGANTTPAVNALFIADDSLVLKVLFIVILAPIIEEFLFRKLLLERMRPYGERRAVFTTALMFGLFHGNLAQFFYAFGLGLVFGYIVSKTGKLRYSIALHMLINLWGGVLSVELLRGLDMDDLLLLSQGAFHTRLSFGTILFLVAIIGMIVAAIAGLVLFLLNLRNFRFQWSEMELPKGQKFSIVYGNVGMLLFALVCLALFIYSLVM